MPVRRDFKRERQAHRLYRFSVRGIWRGRCPCKGGDSADARGDAFFFDDFESAYNACPVNVRAAAEFLAECLIETILVLAHRRRQRGHRRRIFRRIAPLRRACRPGFAGRTAQVTGKSAAILSLTSDSTCFVCSASSDFG